MYIKWLVFSCDLLSLYSAVHFLRMWLSGIMAITKNNSDSGYPWNMPLWIFTSAKLSPFAVNSTLQVSMVFSINCTIWSGILYILDSVVSSFGGPYRKPFFVVNPGYR